MIFNAASGSGTVTIPPGPTNVAKSVTFLAATNMTVITGTGRLDLTSDFTLKLGMILTNWTGQLFFYTPFAVAPTRTLTTANNIFRNSLIQFERPSSGAGGDLIINGTFNHTVGQEIINLQNKSNYVTFNGNCFFSGFNVTAGTANLLNGFSEALTTFIRVSQPNGVFNSFGNGNVNAFSTDGESNLNAGNTPSGNTYNFNTVSNLTTSSASTGTLSIVNCSITINTSWTYGTNNLASSRRLNAGGSTIRFPGGATSFEPQNYVFNNIICNDNSSNSYLNWNFGNYHVAGHVTRPSFNTIILDRNINFAFDNTYLPATAWPTVNVLMMLTPNHRYVYSSTRGEAIGSVFRFNIPDGATLEMLGTCDKPIWLERMAWEFGATTIINSDNIRSTNVLAVNNTSPYAICSSTKSMGANSYAITGTSTSYAGWDISSTNPIHRNLVWVGPYNTSPASIFTISPTTPSVSSNSSNTGLVFTVNSNVRINSADVYATNTSGSAQSIVSAISHSTHQG